METITITATIPEQMVDTVEFFEEQWNEAEAKAEDEPDCERECRLAVDQAYAAIGRAVLEQYYATLTREADHA
jgi:hypothetical protein